MTEPTRLAHEPLPDAVERNIAALMRHEEERVRRATLQQRVADRITRFAGSMAFVYIHMVLFGGWILVNVGLLPILPAWDESLVILAMVASVEAIFLSTFVLISQNRMAAIAERRAELNLQISLLSEHETTRLMDMVAALTERLGVATPQDREVAELRRDVTPEAVLSRLEQNEEKAAGR